MNGKINPLAFVALFAALLAVLVPCCAPVAIVLGLLALLQPQDGMGKIVAGIAVLFGVAFLVMLVLALAGVVGFNTLAVCCTVCGNFGSGQ
jgi:hypothetical protein